MVDSNNEITPEKKHSSIKKKQSNDTSDKLTNFNKDGFKVTKSQKEEALVYNEKKIKERKVT